MRRMHCATLAYSWSSAQVLAMLNLHYANAQRRPTTHDGISSIEHDTGGRTTLYAVRVCCRVCNMHPESYCEAMAEWVMFDTDL